MRDLGFRDGHKAFGRATSRAVFERQTVDPTRHSLVVYRLMAWRADALRICDESALASPHGNVPLVPQNGIRLVDRAEVDAQIGRKLTNARQTVTRREFATSDSLDNLIANLQVDGDFIRLINPNDHRCFLV